MAAPPVLVGAVQRTVAEALPAVAAAPVGVPGAVAGAAGVTALDRAEYAPSPAELVARTLKVYVVPGVRPVTVALVAVAAAAWGVPTMVPALFTAAILYPLTGAPP